MNNELIFGEVIAALRGIQYGEIIIVVHNSEIVQIEKKEKKRFPKGVMALKNNSDKK